MKVVIDLPDDRYRRDRLEELVKDWNDMEPDYMFEESYRGNYVAEKLSTPLVQDVIEHFDGHNIHIVAYQDY